VCVRGGTMTAVVWGHSTPLGHLTVDVARLSPSIRLTLTDKGGEPQKNLD